ncbi:MAG: DUF177 domain-containing protein [Clostridia bacterium]|nr:DUF177 domain-containing protein [Clostridia bacterium]
MVLNISSLLAGEKNRIDIDYMLSVSVDDMDGVVNLSGVTFPTPARVIGVITDNAGYMRMALSVTLPYVALCARCACEVRGEFAIDFERTVVPEGMVEDAEEKDEDFVVAVNGMLDIDEQLTEVLLLDFPTRVLCKEDCKGLCQKCGKDLNEGECNCPKTDINPAFAKILSMFDEEEK